MFANFGHESEHRDEQKRQTGRRHAPREMTTDNGVPAYYTTEAAAHQRAVESYRREQVNNANQGRSFMDQMFDRDQNQSQLPGKSQSAPRDQLNLFSWGKHENVEGPARRGNQGLSDTQLRRIHPHDAEETRQVEARKFEQSTQGNFLSFSEHEKKAAVPAPKPGRSGAPYGSPQHGMLDSLNRGDGIHGQRRSKRPVQAHGPDSTAPEVAGFPGLGQHAGVKQAGRRPMPAEPTKVFLPTAEAAMADPVYSPSQRAHPQLVTDQRYAPASGPVPQPRHDDGGYGGYTPRKGQGPQPAWLQESSIQCGAGGMGPAEHGERYQPGQQQGRRHVTYEDQHRQVVAEDPQRRTLLHQYHNCNEHEY